MFCRIGRGYGRLWRAGESSVGLREAMRDYVRLWRARESSVGLGEAM